MQEFSPVYVPVGVPTFHLESAQAQFDASAALLKSQCEALPPTPAAMVP